MLMVIQATEWMATTLVPGSMPDGLFGWRYSILAPQSPRACFSLLRALPARRTGVWRAVKMAETLFPNCKMPHCNYTHTEFECYTKANREAVEILTGAAFSGDAVTTGKLLRLCVLHARCAQHMGLWPLALSQCHCS